MNNDFTTVRSGAYSVVVPSNRYERAAREYAEILGDKHLNPTSNCQVREEFEQWLYEEVMEEKLHEAEMEIGEW